jgi:methylenetetrahydrofolate dehydrogenase (NADP+)/methenyltetrahydrofolate cyclohydrolase
VLFRSETKILDGSKYQDSMMLEIGKEIAQLSHSYRTKPGISFVVMTGHEPLLKYTIDLHVRAAEKLGFNVMLNTFPHTVEEVEVINLIHELNDNDEVHAIVLLQPLPTHMSAINITQSINPLKEVEGFHPKNMIETVVNGIEKSRYPMCLPMSLFELFKREEIEIKNGSEFVFILDDYFFNNPFTKLVARTAASSVVPNACSYNILSTSNVKLADHVKRADFLFVISKQVEFLNPQWLKQGVCIVDIYSNLVKEVHAKKDSTKMTPVIRGGVNTESVKGIAGAISPCPGGLMQILLAVLFRNAVLAFKIGMKNKVVRTYIAQSFNRIV